MRVVKNFKDMKVAFFYTIVISVILIGAIVWG